MNLLKSLVTVSSITTLSRILGFVRDAIIAQIFGINMMTDAFFIAFRFPNLLRRIFAEGALSQALLPILTEQKNLQDKKKVREFISYIFGLLIIFLIFIVLIGILMAPWIIMILAPGFSYMSEKFFLTVKILQITFPYILLISLTTLIGVILNVWNYFFVPAFTPVLLNLSMISFILFSEVLYFHPSIVGLAWSILVGGILQIIFQLPYLKKIEMLVLPKIKFQDIRVWNVLRSMSVIVLSVSSGHISLIINTFLASFLVSGSISWMYYSDRLMEFPIGIFGTALSTILLPQLSYTVSKNNHKDCFRLIDWGLRLSWLLILPSAVTLGFLSKPLIILLFKYGKFSEFDVLMTQNSLIFYSTGLLGLVLVKILVSAFYAYRNVKTPMRIVFFVIFFIQCMNITLVHTLKHVVFSLSISLGACLNAGLLFWNFKKKYLFQPQPGWLLFFCQLIIATFVMCVIYTIFLVFVSDWMQGTIFFKLFRICGIIILGGSSYFFTLWFLGVRLKNFICWIRFNLNLNNK